MERISFVVGSNGGFGTAPITSSTRSEVDRNNNAEELYSQLPQDTTHPSTQPPAFCIVGTRKQADMETEWLTANEAAQYLKVKPRTLLQWVRERKIPAHRLSGVRRCVWRFRKHELDAILCSSSADPAEGRQ